MTPTHHSRPVPWAYRALAGLLFLGIVSCSSGPTQLTVFPVKGKVLVNGAPAAEAQIVLNPKEKMANPVAPSAITEKDGTFELTTYKAKDGAPEGEYIVTITWKTRSGITQTDYEGPDQLGGAYDKIDKTQSLPGFVVKIDKKPQELPPFQLKQSAEAKQRAEELKRGPKNFGGPLGGGS